MRVIQQPEQWLHSRFHWLELLILCATVMVLGACEPGSSDGGIDPAVIEIPVALIKRPIPVDNQGDPVQADLREPLLFSQGGDVYLRTNSTAGAPVTNITSSVTLGMGDVKGLNSSFDGKKIIFSLRLFDPDPNDNIVPSWNIFEYDIENSLLQRIITSDLVAEEGDDLFPAYLPDGRIVFTSNRQRQSREMLINEVKPGYAALDEDEGTVSLVLHVMNSDGSDIHQISFNQSHDLHPQVLSSNFGGQIVFSRWDNAGPNNAVNIYKVNPDGSELELLYGARSHATGTGGANIHFTGIREMANGDLMSIAKPFTGTFDGGDILIIDADRFVDIDKAIWPLAGLGGPAQVSATVNNVTTDGSISESGRYSSAFPLRDGSGRILVSKSTCQILLNNIVRPCIDPYVSDPAAQEESPAYAIWLYDMGNNTEKPLVLAEQGIVITEAIAVQAIPLPLVIFDRGPGQLDTGWETESVGVVNIKSVYDMADTMFNACFFNVCSPAVGINSVQDFADPLNATADQRPARFVRFVKAVGIPDPNDPNLANPPDLDNEAFGPQRNRGMREIVGYAQVEPDGSVKVKVPANVPLAVEVLDGEGRRIGPQHLNWIQVQPGDTVNCVGCHDTNNGGATPEVHARVDGHAPSINSGLPVGLQYLNTLIPGTTTPNPYWGDLGQTMAEVRFDRVSLMVPPSIQPQLSPDLVYDDYWTDPALAAAPTLRPPDASYAYRYANLDASVPSPLNPFCVPWQFNCRTIINYPQQIQAIWLVNRGLADNITPMAPANPANNDPTNTPLVFANAPNGVLDDTCTECHTSLAGTRLPYGQLDLTIDPNQDPNDFFRSFRELLFAKQGRMFDGANLVPFTILDGMGNQVNDPAAVVSPSMTANGARSSYFIEKMTGGELDAPRSIPAGSVDHTVMLTGDELKLISEWLDLGAQNFNDPFDPAAPQN